MSKALSLSKHIGRIAARKVNPLFKPFVWKRKTNEVRPKRSVKLLLKTKNKKHTEWNFPKRRRLRKRYTWRYHAKQTKLLCFVNRSGDELYLKKWRNQRITHTSQSRISAVGALVTTEHFPLVFSTPKNAQWNTVSCAQRTANLTASHYKWLFKYAKWGFTSPKLVKKSFPTLHRKTPKISTNLLGTHTNYRNTFTWLKFDFDLNQKFDVEYEKNRVTYKVTQTWSKQDFVAKQKLEPVYLKNGKNLPRHRLLKKRNHSPYWKQFVITESYRREGKWDLDKETRTKKTHFVTLSQTEVKFKALDLKKERENRPEWQVKQWRKEYNKKKIISWADKQLASKKNQVKNEARSNPRSNAVRKRRWLLSKKFGRRKKNIKLRKFQTNLEIGEKLLPHGRKRIWPAVVVQDQYFPPLNWAGKNLSRKRRYSAVAKTSFRSRALLVKRSAHINAINQKSNSALHKLKKKLPYYSLNYILKPRKWHTPRDKAGRPVARLDLSEAENITLSAQKEWRHQKKQELFRASWVEKDLKKKSALLKEAKSKDLRPPKYIDPVWRELEAETGYPATLGYRHERTTFRNTFVTNRWWQPIATPTPVRQPFALIKTEAQPTLFKKAYDYSLYYSEIDFYSTAVFSHRTSNINRNVPVLTFNRFQAYHKKRNRTKKQFVELTPVLELRHDLNTNEFKDKIDSIYEQLRFLPIQKKQVGSVNLLSKEMGTVYQIWRKRQRIKNKTSALLLSSCDHGEGKVHAVYDLPFERPRFPALGDNVISYAGSLRYHYRKVRRPRFKYISQLNFTRVTTPQFKDKKVLQARTEISLAHEFKRKHSIATVKNVYVSKSWRLLSNNRRIVRDARYSHDLRTGQRFTGVKRRFTKDPIKERQEEQKEVAWGLNPKITAANKSYRLHVLRTGLRKRTETTVVLDDRTEIRLRFPPVDQILPDWRERQNVDDVYQSSVSKKFQKKFARYNRSAAGVWSWDPYSITATTTNKQPYKKHSVSPSGEDLVTPTRFERAFWVKSIYRIWRTDRLEYLNSDLWKPTYIRNYVVRTKKTDYLGRRLRKISFWDYNKRRVPFGSVDKSEDKEIYAYYAKTRAVRRQSKHYRTKIKIPRAAQQKWAGIRPNWDTVWDLSSALYLGRQKRKLVLRHNLKSVGQAHPKRINFQSTRWWRKKENSKKGRAGKKKDRLEDYKAAAKLWRFNHRKRNKRKTLSYRIRKKRPRASREVFSEEFTSWINKAVGLKVTSLASKKRKVNNRTTKTKDTLSELPTVRARLMIKTPRELSPVHRSFYTKLKKNVRTVKKKKKKIVDTKTSAYKKYRYTAEIVESTTSFFPALRSWLRKLHFNTNTEDHPETERLISNVYWSIRFYLGQDFFNARLYRQDESKHLRIARTDDLYEEADSRFFEDEHAEAIQARRQPFSITRKKPQWKGGLWFLRYWFPRLYKCHLEDALRYDDLTFAVPEAMRVQPGGSAVAKWETLDLKSTDEYAFGRRLRASPDQKISRRYETRLKTVRRQKPILAGLVPNTNFVEKYDSDDDPEFHVSTHFFKKNFSTDFRPHEIKIQLTLTRERFTFLRRHFSPLDAQPSLEVVAKAYTRRKKLMITHGRRHRSLDREGHSEGSVHLRYTRGKSPRNAQYLQRQNKAKSNIVSTFRSRELLKLKRSRTAKFDGESIIVGRDPRANLPRRELLFPQFNPFVPRRQQILLRRKPSALRARRQTGIQIIPVHIRRGPRKESRRNHDKVVLDELKIKKVQTHNASLLWATEDYSPFNELGTIGSTLIVTGKPSLLELRTAKQRTSFFYWSHKPLLTVQSVRVRKATAWRHLLRTRHEERRVIQARKKFITYGSFAALTAVVYPKTRSKYEIRIAIKMAEKQRLVERRATLTDLPAEIRLDTNDLTFENNKSLMMLPRKQEVVTNALAVFDENVLVDETKSVPLRKTFAIFRHTIRGIYKIHYAVYKTKIEEKGRNRINEVRGEFWELLTSKHYLKLRFFKNWLKERKRYLIRSEWSEIPEVIFKERRARVRLFEWVESDEHFFREGWKNAFRLYPSERALAPWLQPLIRRRITYNTAHGEYRRYAFPREQKRLKARQYYRKSRASLDPKSFYVKGRRWPRVRTTAYRRARSLFEFRNTHSAQTHFKKLSKYTTKTTGFSRNAIGLYNRLDVNLILLKFFATVFWARRFAGYGIVKVNTVKVTKANHRFLPGDRIEFAWEKIKRAQAIFIAHAPRHRSENLYRHFRLQELPGNYAWHSGFRRLTYKNLPIPEDVPDNARLCRWLFDSFRRDAGIGRR